MVLRIKNLSNRNIFLKWKYLCLDLPSLFLPVAFEIDMAMPFWSADLCLWYDWHQDVNKSVMLSSNRVIPSHYLQTSKGSERREFLQQSKDSE